MQRYDQIVDVNFVVGDVDKKYADGLGRLENYEPLLIESSSGITQENIIHTLEDTHLKNCKFQAVLRSSTFGVRVIKNTLTLSKMSLKNESQWKFVELRSAIVPTKWGDRFEWANMFELLVKLLVILYPALIEQEEVIMVIKKENPGLEYVAAEETFSARLNKH